MAVHPATACPGDWYAAGYLLPQNSVITLTPAVRRSARFSQGGRCYTGYVEIHTWLPGQRKPYRPAACAVGAFHFTENESPAGIDSWLPC